VLSIAAGLFALTVCCSAASPAAGDGNSPPATPIYVVANQDLALPFQNQIAFYLASGTQLTQQSSVSDGGYGIQGGFFGAQRVNSVPNASATCFYVSNAASNDIASISLQTQQLIGNFSGSQKDSGSANGIGLAVNNNYLYAGYTSSKTIATFSTQSGCGLTFLGDTPAVGLHSGPPIGMAVNGKLLVVAYGDGSIQSFNVTGGIPVANPDLRNSNGYVSGGAFNSLPSAVDMTQDGRFAIFGDVAPTATVEVAFVGAGRLQGTTVYRLGTAVDAGSVRLSPDQSLIYMANSESGTVTAAFFNKSTGQVTPGCTSPTLQGFNGRPWLGSVVTRDTTGTGNVLYVAEFGRDRFEINHGPSSALGILTVTSNGVSCSLKESTNSPVIMSFPGTLSLGVFPPRPF
jgi:hypothetical protein